jgi:endonuclease YncB( thermonuclease family)
MVSDVGVECWFGSRGSVSYRVCRSQLFGGGDNISLEALRSRWWRYSGVALLVRDESTQVVGTLTPVHANHRRSTNW